MLGIEPFSPPASEGLTPKYLSAPALDSPLQDMPGVMDGMDPVATSNASIAPAFLTSPERSAAIMTPPLPTTIAPSSLPISVPTTAHQQQQQPPQHSSPITPCSAISSPISPSQEEARRALEVVMNFFAQPNGLGVEPQEYIAMGKLMEKLKLHSRHGSLDHGCQPHGLGLVRPSLSRSGTGAEMLASIPETGL